MNTDHVIYVEVDGFRIPKIMTLFSLEMVKSELELIKKRAETSFSKERNEYLHWAEYLEHRKYVLELTELVGA